MTSPVLQSPGEEGYFNDTKDALLEVALKTPSTGQKHYATDKGVIGSIVIGTQLPALVPGVFNSIWGALNIPRRIG